MLYAAGGCGCTRRRQPSCGTDDGRWQLGLGSFVGSLASEASVGLVVVVVVLPFLEFLVEQAGVVLDDAI